MVAARTMGEQISWSGISKDLLAILMPVSIWVGLVMASTLESGWFSFSCSGLVGLFIWLTALAYGEKRFANLTVIGVLIAASLSLFSGLIALSG
ncbi:MAG: hypothetical protein CMA31_04080 [Euryarchaeota archaeon]|nr:hypothetical protein [Euryarchaeota archaeon]|tara:strand:- start:2078 stop:2359 length:282 start_codon:yes stop_codon:yes gene_type:complete